MVAAPAASKLALRELTCRFGTVTAVDRATLALARGEFVSLLGPSGCGKTTTLRMIAGFLDPTEGTIELDGRVISAPGRSLPPEKRGMSMIFQSYAIWPNMTVAENVGFGLEVRRLPRAEIRDKVDRILDVVRMRALRDRYPAELSGGQQQRVALARAIVVQPDVLLLDEPLSNLDANLRDEMRYAIPRARFADATALRGRLTFSLRPQSVHLHRHPPPPSDRAAVLPGRVVQRAYLGEHWDYAVRPKDGALQLRVTARPHEVFEVDERVWLELDARQMSPITE